MSNISFLFPFIKSRASPAVIWSRNGPKSPFHPFLVESLDSWVANYLLVLLSFPLSNTHLLGISPPRNRLLENLSHFSGYLPLQAESNRRLYPGGILVPEYLLTGTCSCVFGGILWHLWAVRVSKQDLGNLPSIHSLSAGICICGQLYGDGTP